MEISNLEVGGYLPHSALQCRDRERVASEEQWNLPYSWTLASYTGHIGHNVLGMAKDGFKSVLVGHHTA